MTRLIPALIVLSMPSAAMASMRADLHDYALASCLTKQSASHDLRTEGYRLADIVLARAGVSPLAWKPLDGAVAAAFAKQAMLMVHVDGPVAQATQPAPLATCLLVIEHPSVCRAARGLAGTGKR